MRISHGVHVHFLRLKGMHIDVMQIAVIPNSNNQSDTVACKQAALQDSLKIEVILIAENSGWAPQDLQGRKTSAEAAACLPLPQNKHCLRRMARSHTTLECDPERVSRG